MKSLNEPALLRKCSKNFKDCRGLPLLRLANGGFSTKQSWQVY